MTAYRERCQAALKRAVWQEQHGMSPTLQTEQMDGVDVGQRAAPDDPRVVYFIGATRATAAITISRLILALYHAVRCTAPSLRSELGARTRHRQRDTAVKLAR